MEYHSALKGELDIRGELSEFRRGGSVVFAWDVLDGAHPYFREADALYTEPSWRQGYSRFLARAGCAGSSAFPGYLAALKKVIEELQVPTYVFMGKHMRRGLSPPLVVTPVKKGFLDGLVGIWYTSAPARALSDPDSWIEFVCDSYEVILDPCCGYGNVAAAARRFVCSDINRRCVYYVAKTFMDYKDCAEEER